LCAFPAFFSLMVKWTKVPSKPDASSDVSSEVDLARPFAEGGFGQVFRGRVLGESGSPKDCAAKRMLLNSKGDIQSFEAERSMLKAVGHHKHIVEFFGTAQEKEGKDTHGWIFLEMATGGELFDRLIDSGNLKEYEAHPYISAIAGAIAHCFSRGIIHRDLKLENVMLMADDPRGVKVIDFGLALQLDVKNGKIVEKKVKDTAGTQAYRPPESNLNKYHSPLKIDVWALGIVSFSLVAGFFPLQEAKLADWRYKRLAGDQSKGIGASKSIFATYKRECFFSESLRELIDGMLCIDYEKRLSVEQVMNHPWIVNGPPPMPTRGGNGGIVYRGAGDDDEIMEELVPDPELKIVRQRAPKRQLVDEAEDEPMVVEGSVDVD